MVDQVLELIKIDEEKDNHMIIYEILDKKCDEILEIIRLRKLKNAA